MSSNLKSARDGRSIQFVIGETPTLSGLDVQMSGPTACHDFAVSLLCIIQTNDGGADWSGSTAYIRRARVHLNIGCGPTKSRGKVLSELSAHHLLVSAAT